MRLIEAKTLKAEGACQDQYKLFLATFGESVEVTVELCQAHSDKFDWSWAARSLLSPTALAEYYRVTTSARAKFVSVTALTREEFARMTASALAEYVRVTAAPARAEYDRVAAPAFATAYINDII